MMLFSLLSRNILSPFENAYLSRSVSRLLDPVHTMFSGGAVPGQEDIDSLIRTITRYIAMDFKFIMMYTISKIPSLIFFKCHFSELSVSLVDEGLSTVVARNVGKAIRLFCLKCEQNLVTGGEASQVIDSPTVGQQKNVNLANLLYYLSTQTNRVIANLSSSLPTEGAVVIATALEEISNLSRNIIAPLLSSIKDAIESIILTMHDDPEFREYVSKN